MNWLGPDCMTLSPPDECSTRCMCGVVLPAKSSIYGSSTRPITNTAAPYDLSVKESMVGRMVIPVYASTLVATRADIILQPAARSAVSPFQKRDNCLVVRPDGCVRSKMQAIFENTDIAACHSQDLLSKHHICRLVSLHQYTAVDSHTFSIPSIQHDNDVVIADALGCNRWCWRLF